MNALLNHSCHAEFARALEVLRKSRLKITQPRQAILKVLIQEHGPFTMEELHRRIKKGPCDLVTVYRCLATLAKVGLVRRCDFGDGNSRYEFSGSGHHHHHIICNACQHVEVLDACLIEDLERLVRDKGYLEISHSLEFFGVCSDCQKRISLPRHSSTEISLNR